MIILRKELKGSILDIGGGGEAFIGRTYGEQVVAIDHSQEELDEAPSGFKKILMDATDLKYENGHFDNVTFFYTLMYMTASEQAKAISEAARVLKKGGSLAIWDCEITSAYPDPFLVDVDVLMDEHKYHTTYGIVKKIRKIGHRLNSYVLKWDCIPLRSPHLRVWGAAGGHGISAKSAIKSGVPVNTPLFIALFAVLV